MAGRFFTTETSGNLLASVITHLKPEVASKKAESDTEFILRSNCPLSDSPYFQAKRATGEPNGYVAEIF